MDDNENIDECKLNKKRKTLILFNNMIADMLSSKLWPKNEVFHEGCLQQKWPNPQETADLVTFTEEIVIGKLHFLGSEMT